MFSVINCQIEAGPVQHSLKTQPDMEIGKESAARGLLGRFHHRA